jgi:transcriptional regulator with XRE-family HTH domain
MSNIAKNLRKLRETKGLSQERLARLADVANNTIVKIEAGKNQNPTLDTLKKIAKALEVNVDDLIK